MDIKSIKDDIQGKYGDIEIKLLDIDDIEEYVDICKSEFYNKNSDFNFNTDITRSELVSAIKNIIVFGRASDNSAPQVRAVVKRDGKIIAGFTLMIFNNTDCIELAYFVIPEMQGRGIGYKMLSSTVSKIIGKACKIQAVIHNTNTPSLTLIKKLEFEYSTSIKGSRWGDNLIYVKRNKESK
jgi:L-amino acid N-acyltransferase YncA